MFLAAGYLVTRALCCNRLSIGEAVPIVRRDVVPPYKGDGEGQRNDKMERGKKRLSVVPKKTSSARHQWLGLMAMARKQTLLPLCATLILSTALVMENRIHKLHPR